MVADSVHYSSASNSKSIRGSNKEQPEPPRPWCENRNEHAEPIPKIIIQTVKTKEDLSGSLGLDWTKNHASLKEKNPDYNFLLFDDKEALEFIDTFFEDSPLPDVVRKVPRPVMKADLFRLAAVSVLGGFYMDMDMYAKESFDPIVYSGCGAAVPKEWWRDDQAHKDRHFSLPADGEDRWQAGNYAFAALPNHPLMVDALNEAIKRTIGLIVAKENKDDVTDLDVLRSTGPYMLTEVFHAGRKAGKYKDVSHIEGDQSKPLKKGQEYGFDWHKFGPYAEHMLSHTWVKAEEEIKAREALQAED